MWTGVRQLTIGKRRHLDECEKLDYTKSIDINLHSPRTHYIQFQPSPMHVSDNKSILQKHFSFLQYCQGNLIYIACCPWSHGQEIVRLCPYLLSEFLAKGHWPRASRQLRLSVNVKGDNYMIFGIYLTVEENSSKTHLGDDLIKAVRPVIASNGSLSSKWGR